MQGGARKAAMSGFFFFTKKRLDGAASAPPAAHRAHRAGLTILPTIPADTRAPPARQAGFMPGSDRCAAILAPARARRAAKSSDAGTEAGAVPPRRVRPAARAGMPRGAPHRRGQRFFAKEARGIVKGDGKRAAAQGETGAAVGCTEWGKRPSAGDGRADDGGAGRGNAENGGESGRVRTGQDEEESGRARRGHAGVEETEP